MVRGGAPEPRDCFDLPLTTSSSAAERYAHGVDRLLAGEGGALDPLRAAVELDPSLAVAHVALALACDEAKDVPTAARHRALADGLAEGGASMSARERAHVRILLALAAGPDARGMEAARAHLTEHPRDGLVLDTYQRHLFFHGGAGRRTRLVELFEALAPAWAGHPYAWYADAKLALHYEEAGAQSRAHECAERAYVQRPRNTSAVHALIHIAHAAGRHHEGAARLRDWLAHLDPVTAFYAHLWWHVTLAALAAGDVDGARRLWEERVRPARSSGTRQLALADAVGLLWSWQLAAPQSAPPWDEAVALAKQLMKSAGRPFVDVHCAVAFLATGDRAALREQIAAIEASPAPLAHSTSLPLVRAIALVLDDPRAACLALTAHEAGDVGDAMGGSNVERALLLEVAAHAAQLAHLSPPAAAAASPHPIVARLAARG